MKLSKLYKGTFWIMFLILGFGLTTSCQSDDDNADDGKVELLSFGPSGKMHGETITFIGRNLDKVTSIKLPGSEVSSTEFSAQTAEKIDLVIPEETSEGNVVLVFPEGEITSKTVLSFDVPFTISGFTPNAKPGENITIKGKFLNWVKVVMFTDNVEVIDFESISFDELVVKVPMDAKTGPISIIGGGTEPYPYESETELALTLPAATSIAPQAVKHDDILIISGTDLDLVMSVVFPQSGEVVGLEKQTETEIRVKVPVDAIDGNLALKAYSGSMVAVEQSLSIILPKLSTAMPTPVEIGADLTLAGTDLDLVKEVLIPGAPGPISSFVSHTATEIVLTVPEGSFNGAIRLNTIHDFMVETEIKIEIAGLTDIPLGVVIFDDEYKSGFGNWSWGGPTDTNYTANVREGKVAIKKEWEDNDGLRFGGGNASTEGMTELVFSVYGGEGLGKDGKLSVMINEQWGITQVQVVIGEWTDFVIPLTDLPLNDPSKIGDFALQGTNGYVIVDKVGLR